MIDSGDPPARRSRLLVEQLKRSPVYRDYERAFHAATGLPLDLRPVESFDPPHQGAPNESRLCALLAAVPPACAACLQFTRRLEESAQTAPRTRKCFAGLWETSVPVRAAGALVGCLQTGQVLLRRPAPADFALLARQLAAWDSRIPVREVEAAYVGSRVLTAAQYGALVRLLTTFARHLGAVSDQLVVGEERGESPLIARARAYIAEHQAEDLSLSEVASAVHLSAFYFCKMFKQATGLTFTDYLARIRVERVKDLLLDRRRRISEAAFEAGFQSLSQFNRVFRRVAGEPPTEYRDRVQKTAPA
ncbi:MAG TPA: helix-turn-helix domain-containing protein [Opitutaceae bacterium]|nr:helix-turn-helix domain-containing protein [Opitutaceae bacterium]